MAWFANVPGYSGYTGQLPFLRLKYGFIMNGCLRNKCHRNWALNQHHASILLFHHGRTPSWSVHLQQVAKTGVCRSGKLHLARHWTSMRENPETSTLRPELAE